MAKTGRYLVSALLLSLGVLGLTLVYTTKSHAPRARLVETTITLTAGESYTSQFVPDATHEYFIALYFSSKKDGRDLMCWVGSGYVVGNCKARSLLLVSWRVFTGKQVIAQGDASKFEKNGVVGISQDMVERVIGNFIGSQRIPYSLMLTIHSSPPPLQGAHPLLVVEASPSLATQGEYTTPLIFLFSVLACIAGILQLLGKIW
jgi:hypothetical protein